MVPFGGYTEHYVSARVTRGFAREHHEHAAERAQRDWKCNWTLGSPGRLLKYLTGPLVGIQTLLLGTM